MEVTLQQPPIDIILYLLLNSQLLPVLFHLTAQRKKPKNYVEMNSL